MFFMKKQLLLLCLFVTSFSATTLAQSSFQSCFSKANKKSIDKKMDKFLTRVSNETNVPKDKLDYQVVEQYTTFYSKQCRHLPKVVEFNVNGQKKTYRHNGLSGAVLYWLLGSWTPQQTSEGLATR
jgi:hypothetical protein